MQRDGYSFYSCAQSHKKIVKIPGHIYDGEVETDMVIRLLSLPLFSPTSPNPLQDLISSQKWCKKPACTKTKTKTEERDNTKT